ncbi:MAG: VWA domain-containing protein, partial [Chloroflexota bacterium]|nr:VWA domain-containing protein [Chloroflexota bacterium]
SVMVDKEIGWFNPELATTEGSTIFLPESIKRFNKKEKNFSWLKVIATHQVGHIEFGTFHFKLQKGSKFFKDLRSELKSDLEKDNKNKEITDMTNFFKFFDDVKLAQDIFSIFEAFRVDQKIIKKYLGIKNSFIDVQAACLMGRPKISSLPAREQLLELLIRFSLNDSSQKVAKKLQPSFAKLLSLISILKENDSSVEDTSEATLRAYKILKEIKNSPEGNFDDFDYDLSIEESFSDEQFESLSEFFKSQGEEIVSEDIKDIQNTEDFDLTDQQEQNTNLEDYNSPQEVEFWGEFKPELSQLLYEMGASEAEFSDDGDLTDLSQEQLEEMLKDSVEESQKDEDDQVPESDITQNLEDALKDMQMDSNDEDQSKFADKFDHFDEDGKSLEAIEDNQYLYDEWDFRDETYKKNWCLVNEKTIGEGDLVYYEETLEKYSDIVKDIKKQFELINPETYRKIKRLQDGEEQDLDLTVEAMIDLRSGITPSEKLYWRRNKVERSIAVAFLLDMSASTAEAIDDSSSQSDEWSAPSDPEKYMEWLRKRRSQGFRRSYKRIVDLEKEGLILLLDALETLGDKYGIFGFSGYGRENVEYYTIKDLDEKFSPTIPKRIDRISPLHATRMGPAVRHCASKLMQTDERSKFIFLISDGRPQDRGYSREGVEKEYAVNDTKKALLEAKKQGITTFCLTVDKEGHDYMKSMMDDLSYEVLDDISSLPLRIPQLYKNLTSD